MSGQRAAAEPYATRFETEVSAVDGRRVWLDSTHFFAESGGQPADYGTIGDVPVVDVQVEDNEHVHVLESEPRFRAGKRVLCSIDWEARMYCMRAHTASHVLFGAARRVFDDVTYTGLEIGDERVRLDLATDERVDDDALVELDELVNRAVWESRPVSWDSMPVSEARETDEIHVSEATEDTAFEKGRVRVVTIGDADSGGANTIKSSRDTWDVAACGGTHVRNTREIGPVTVLGSVTPKPGHVGVELAVGPRAIERREVEKRVTFAASRQLGVPLGEATGELSRLESEREKLADSVGTLQRELVKTRVESAEPFERNGRTWVATTAGVVDADEAGDVAESVAGDLADVVVIAGESDSPFAVVAAGEEADAESILGELTDEFGGGGGGSDRLAWGGDFDVEPDDVVTGLEG
ncbi:alanyl-tRNA synthetase [Halovivax ruber XH-70]|uniref:Alanyl-tRNA synthetase n=1 Tax=Halovivax ruber (strain DSM 18193 / JCM 13892 / XH-70) TaxID=797302 RepID=L0IF99_HALRX|nr:serine-tRNA(Ala) deacylase AlaX [Halovivax ruber]AGB16876.1 alanyl-tRNA synthetase [Halovivax ruber XH-70]